MAKKRILLARTGHIHLVHEPVGQPLGRLLSTWWRTKNAYWSGGKARRSTTDATYGWPFVHPLTHTERISFEALARVGLKPALVESRCGAVV